MELEQQSDGAKEREGGVLYYGPNLANELCFKNCIRGFEVTVFTIWKSTIKLDYIPFVKLY